jgi:hypothetical protein
MPDGVAGLTAAAVQFPVPVTSDDRASAALRAAESLRDNASAWLDRLASWLAGLTRDAIFVDFRAQPRQFHSGNPMLFAVTGDGPAKRVPGRVDINVNLRTVTPASHGHWETALKRASAGVELPLEHALMNSARLAIAHADYRRAVLDSATAAELSLSSEIKRALDRISQFPALSKFLQGKHNTLELLRQLAPSIGVSLPNNLQVVIGHPRKFAMHHGTLPTKADTEAAVRMAEELVERASPIA